MTYRILPPTRERTGVYEQYHLSPSTAPCLGADCPFCTLFIKTHAFVVALDGDEVCPCGAARGSEASLRGCPLTSDAVVIRSAGYSERWQQQGATR